jgi:hypothetical protein
LLAAPALGWAQAGRRAKAVRARARKGFWRRGVMRRRSCE